MANRAADRLAYSGFSGHSFEVEPDDDAHWEVGLYRLVFVHFRLRILEPGSRFASHFRSIHVLM